MFYVVTVLLTFLFQIAEIKRLLPRLKSMSFRLHHSEVVQDIKPVSTLNSPFPP